MNGDYLLLSCGALAIGFALGCHFLGMGIEGGLIRLAQALEKRK